MTEHAGGPEFRGSFTGLAAQMIAAVLPVAAAAGFLFFGPVGGRIFLVSLLLMPVLLALAWAISRVDRLRFLDAERVLLRNLRPPVAYEDLADIRFLESLGTVQVTGRAGKRTELLSAGLVRDEAERLRRALRERVPGCDIESRGYAAWKLTAIAVALVAGVSMAGSFYMEWKAPVVGVDCAEAVPAARAAERPTLERAGEGVVAKLPAVLEGRRFAVAQTGSFAETGRTGRIFLAIAGLDSEWELFHYAACSRFGLVPRLLKIVLLSRWESPQIYTSTRGSTKALLVAGRRDGVSEGRVLLYDETSQLEAMVAVILDEELTVPLLATHLSQFSLQPRGG